MTAKKCADCDEPTATPRTKRCADHWRENHSLVTRRATAKYREANPDRVAEWNAKHNAANRASGYFKEWNINVGYWNNIRLKYGITKDEYYALFEAQGFACAICRHGTSQDRRKMLCVDHDHATGRVRGLLCVACNSVLGYAEDDVDRLMAAAAYLMSTVDLLERTEGP